MRETVEIVMKLFPHGDPCMSFFTAFAAAIVLLCSALGPSWGDSFTVAAAVKFLFRKRPSLRPWRHHLYMETLWLVEHARQEWQTAFAGVTGAVSLSVCAR